ncbi:Asp-tRNA(Asn)/Glu-tRNA(Gln) amidotransferase subunit GatC [Pseudohongiella sp. SYSU M77423]|jgi:aspartyl-tRNA(Asn)/glutamyl-tRNA(Gln) amidotransferase subunit C|uniref:Asp-tRNA(Asn)/Glu-tRNA(Gln) amidotransferase subunit GatC n=1 Tax=unclassified Pseudohongiella TaxID=2629611 RepID=UPI000C60B5A5|nr:MULTISPECIES: Asp-tRNA(Asn)/Glu-tRNA(Gln) amidotransferase subunit GatC [unclassified Pseudohongiella]MAY57199.1 Asp-tRNA(Asn)/Glu-tRNA(Gln) amidotransferase GatCAB subunit C [Gammaproteobacteria bacterium]HBN15427.1 Asp-tRNA(Asn)/Glu-tRNA(Gln) amidotransferase GatCAB subunit C [Pseudohongiella sp.]MBJ53894.1 Asp-tRNA(Asn)/Glu-tRNA(Gln) amidotransferase GatCAB subunit C [Gammaproteobacteria bacterium]MDH7942414.1 Asp-tRNA(Asn)/Glu-tRNA(Gln) amidotransferase subunit GatC [Pseudohongiella sp. |tara:strand:+ start:811 stop:1098 length:288 start_codon:yes stop_codon:yes gene_type:complete
MALDNTDVEKIAHLARLQIKQPDIDEVTSRISNILTMIDQMQSIDTSAVTPMAHPFDATQRLRPDQVTETNQRDRLQQIAPATENGLYLVPKVIE